MQTIKEWPNFLGGPHDTLFYDTLLFFYDFNISYTLAIENKHNFYGISGILEVEIVAELFRSCCNSVCL